MYNNTALQIINTPAFPASHPDKTALMTQQILHIALQLAVCYLALVLIVYFKQRSLQYFPGRESSGSPADSGVPEMKIIEAPTADGLKLYAWFAPPRKKDGQVVALFHGNAGDLRNRAAKARGFIDKGYGVYLCEYRGFGGNPGALSEEGLYNDARAALAWLKNEGYGRDQFIIYGESLGTGVAVQMALELQPPLLILEAGFSAAVDVAKSRYPFLPVDLMLKDRYDSITKIGRVHAALLMFHGTDDEVVPFRFGEKLFAAAAEPKRFAAIRGGHHSDLYDFGAGMVIADWLAAQAKTQPAAQQVGGGK
jgi:alpha-beta hydrolase superfamily lysophospholipase